MLVVICLFVVVVVMVFFLFGLFLCEFEYFFVCFDVDVVVSKIVESFVCDVNDMVGDEFCVFLCVVFRMF